MKIKIFVAYHADAEIIQNDIYEPIHVGKATSNVNLNMIGDETGVNISNKNKIYCEMTALYWIWKNYNEIDYVGLCHYRRFFTFEKKKILFFKKNLLYYYSKFILSARYSGHNFIKDCSYILSNIEDLNRANVLFEKKIRNEFTKYDLLTLYPTKFSGMTVGTLFSQPAGIYHLKVMEKFISEKYPHMLITYKKQCNSNEIYPANMFIMNKKLFDQYALFIFDILESHENFCIKDKWCVDPLNEKSFFRLSGYLSEVLTSTFINYCLNSQKYKIKFLNQIFFKG